MAKDYYNILGVSRSANQDEIKKAYRKLALEYHPDRGGDTEKFKEVNEAYQVLSNPQKKAQYDQFGTADDRFQGGFGGGFQGGSDFEDMFSGGGFSGGFGFGDIFTDIFANAFATVNASIEIGLTQAILGDTVRFKTSQGDQIELKIPAGTQDGSSFKFRGKGMPTRNGRGDLILTVRVKLPRRINRKQKELFEELRKEGL